MTIRVTDKDLMEQLRSGPEGQGLLKEREEALQDQRRRQAAELARVRKELADGLPRHDAAAEKARERFQKAHAARMAALQDVATVDRERSTFAQHREQRIAELEVELRRTAPPEIAARRPTRRSSPPATCLPVGTAFRAKHGNAHLNRNRVGRLQHYGDIYPSCAAPGGSEG